MSTNALETSLRDVVAGDCEARRHLTQTVYGELKQLAKRQFAGAGRIDVVLQPTAIINEAMVRLLGSRQLDVKSRTHFMAIAAAAMRWAVVDHARAQQTNKRGGDLRPLTLHTFDGITQHGGLDAVLLNDLLERLAALSERAARVVEMRLFGGMTVAETALALNVSERTVKGDWRTALAWLRAELEDAPSL